MPVARIQRFKDVQASPHAGFEAALAEIRSGRKRGHWIWYVFPQLHGLGSSPPAQEFAVQGVKEAEEFLRDDVLRERLLAIASAVADQLQGAGRASLRELMGSDTDARKVVSSLTLFGHVASQLHRIEGLGSCEALATLAGKVLDRAAAEGFPPCAYTLRFLQSSESE